MANSGIRCWVAATIYRLCHSHTNSILWCCVKVTKAATWFHPSGFFRMIRTKLSSVIDCSPIFCRMVSHLPSTTEMPDTQTGWARHHHLTFLLHLAHSGLSTSLMQNRNALNAPWKDITWVRKKFICPWPITNYASRLCRWVHSPFELPESRSLHLKSVP